MPDNHPKYPNEYQPRRPISDENGEPLSFRTHISRPDSRYDLYDQRNIITQVKLYRWVKSEFVNGTSIAELHGYLFWDQPTVSKRHLGSTILQAVAYNPRKLKGKTKDNPKACQTYVFFNPKDLEYPRFGLNPPSSRRDRFSAKNRLMILSSQDEPQPVRRFILGG